MRDKSGRTINLFHSLAILGLVFCLAGYWLYVHLIDPGPFYSIKYDPEMPYMLNSLAIFKSKPYNYVDHPGTPTELIGTILLALFRLFTPMRGDAFWTYIIRRPEAFLLMAHGFITLASIITLVMMSLRAISIREVKDILLSIAIGAVFYTLIPFSTFHTLVFWSHNSFNFPAGSLLLLSLFVRMQSKRQIQMHEVTFFGVAAGLLMAVQLYFMTWVIGIILVFALYTIFRGGKLLEVLAISFKAGASSMLGFFVATLPVIHRYREFFWWVKKIVLHQGRYGSGPAGIITLNQLTKNIVELYGSARILFFGLGITFFLLSLAMIINHRSIRSEPNWWALTSGLSLQVLITLILIAKHPGRSYLLAIAAIIPLLLALAFSKLKEGGAKVKALCIAVSILIIIGFGNNLSVSIVQYRDGIDKVQNVERELENIKADIADETGKSPQSMIVVHGYGSLSYCAALRFGDVYTEHVFRKEINQVCPNDWVYYPWEKQALLPVGRTPLHESSDWDILVSPISFLPGNATELGRVITSENGDMVFVVATHDVK